MKVIRKQEEEGAPAYMAQYTALMTILLAFFITLLSMGKERVSTYKKDFGLVKEGFGLKGGISFMPFFKSVMAGHPGTYKDTDHKKGDLLGYLKGVFEPKRFDVGEIDQTNIQSVGQIVRITTPIVFPADSANISRNAQEFLDRLGGILYNLPNHMVTASCYQSTGSPDKDQILAARRAAAIVRYLEERCKIPAERLLAIGYANSQYLGTFKLARSDQAVLFFIKKLTSKITI